MMSKYQEYRLEQGILLGLLAVGLFFMGFGIFVKSFNATNDVVSAAVCTGVIMGIVVGVPAFFALVAVLTSKGE